MIKNNTELESTMERIGRFQRQVVALRDSSVSEAGFRAAAGGFLAEIDRMMLDVREYLWAPPAATARQLATA
ncbi:MAG: hypothetical protein ACKVY0_07250 [Prosthecobacter sp.]|uniref:hypothetical protein n=1 Tax=Prosthecobacter sp. TaxID=1965333 RepID=UPI0039033604